MRYLSWIITIPVAIIIVSFAVTNREAVTLGLFPLPFELTLPIYIVVLVPLAVGIILGGLIAWFSAGRHRQRARERGAEVERLSSEVRRHRERQKVAAEEADRDAEAQRLEAARRASENVARLEGPAAAE